MRRKGNRGARKSSYAPDKRNNKVAVRNDKIKKSSPADRQLSCVQPSLVYVSVFGLLVAVRFIYISLRKHEDEKKEDAHAKGTYGQRRNQRELSERMWIWGRTGVIPDQQRDQECNGRGCKGHN